MKSDGMTLEIPTAVLRATRLPPHELQDEFRKELPVALYLRGVLSVGKASTTTTHSVIQCPPLASTLTNGGTES